MRFEAPGIGTKVLTSGQSYEFEYASPKNSADLDDWSQVTLLQRPMIATSQDLVSQIINDTRERGKYCPLKEDYSPRLYYTEDQKAGHYHLCLSSYHAVLDGRGLLFAIDTLLQFLCKPVQGQKWGTEISKLPLPISYAAGLRKDGDSTPDGLPEMMKAARDFVDVNQVDHESYSTKFHSHIIDVYTAFLHAAQPV